MYQNSIGTQHMRTTHEAKGLPTPYFAVPPPQVKAFSEYLRAAGYYCTNNAKTDYQFGVPVTAWDETSTKAHWRNRNPGQPFFAVFNFGTTHESQVWPKPGIPLTTDPASVEIPPYYPDTTVVREDLARHYDNIAAVDKQIGRILGELEDDELAENTVVVFFSDHGDGLPRAKRWLYDSGLHVPMIIRWPGELSPASINKDLISFVDLGPTMLSIAGVKIPGHMQGRAFLGPAKWDPREFVFAARDRIDESYDWVRAVRDGRYKLIRNFFPDKPYVLPVPYRDRGLTMQELLRMNKEGKLDATQRIWFSKSRPAEELYDLEVDPHEIVNLIDRPEQQAVAARLRKVLQDWMSAVDDKGSIPEAEMVAAMWPGGVQPVTETPTVSPFGGSFTAPVEVSIAATSEGASIAYTLESGENPHWLLYSKPMVLESTCQLRIKAVRYGYRESKELSLNYSITAE
jgi:arylsulfatase A-like enzyme